MRATLLVDYAVQYADPISVSAGDPVTVVRPDEQFTRWRWCIAPDGREGWVPETALSTTEAGPARMTARYEATELSARRGDRVQILSEFDGFAWVRSADGRVGWLPAATLERLDDDGEDGYLHGRTESGSMTDEDRVREAAREIADAIGRRDVEHLSLALAPGFVHRSAGGDATGREAFLQSIAEIPGEILSVELDQVTVDLSTGGALVTGVQRARLRVDGELVDDRGVFVDWFVKVEGHWRIQVAVSMPVVPA